MAGNQSDSGSSCVGYLILNLTDKPRAKGSLFSVSEQVVITVVLPCMLIVCLTGNCAFLFAVIRIPRLKTIINFYLVVLSIADVGYVVNGTTGYTMLYLTSPVRSDWPRGYECWLVTAFGRLCYYMSIGIMTLVTLDRYTAICYPFKHRLINTKNRATKLVVLIMVSGIILSSASAYLGYGKRTTFCTLWPRTEEFDHFPKYVNFCSPAIANGRIYYELLIFVPFVVALIVNGYMYCRIVKGLSNRQAVKSGDTQQQNRATEIRNQITRMLVLSGLLFFLCQALRRVASLHVILAITTDYYLFSDKQHGIVVLVGRALLYFNSAINPFVYTAASSHYRKSFVEAFHCTADYQNKELELSKDKLSAVM